jgi:predicted AAA+ superfamily ATPase
MIERKKYTDTLLRWKHKKVIKIITGVRRCGKSTLIGLYIDTLLKIGVKKEQIISLNLENLEFLQLHDYRSLYKYLKERLKPHGWTYIFIDEIQHCKEFERVVNSLFLKDNVDIYITGSNAYMLSGELATHLSGRYIKMDVLPFSFKEYLAAANGATARGKSRQNLKEAFFGYIKNGSFPYISQLKNGKTEVREYIEGIYNTILLKDVAQREKITDITLLESIVKFLSDSQGSPVSAKKIADTLTSSGRKISVNTVEAYIRALTDSYIFYKADRFDVKGKMYLKTLGKYYIVDTGIRNYLSLSNDTALGHLLENIVYFELLRRYKRVYVGKVDNTEIDFVANGDNKLSYYQVAATVLDENVLERELRPLRKPPDNYPKYLLTLDDALVGEDFSGIQRLNLIEWLLGDW